MLLGNKLDVNPGGTQAFDLPRSSNGRALIGDPRNDENSIVSQFQGIMLRFHNRMVDINPKIGFSEVNLEVRRHYQWAVVHDFLPKIVHGDVRVGYAALVGVPAAVSVAGATALQQRLRIHTIELLFAAFLLGVAVWLFVK